MPLKEKEKTFIEYPTMASFPIPPPNPHIIQYCAGVLNQYSIEIHHLRTCMSKQSQELEQKRLEIRNMQDIIAQLQDENRQHEHEAREAGVAIRTQHQIVATQRQLIASLGNDLAQARNELHQPTTFSNQPTSEPTYAAIGHLVTNEQDEGNSTTQESWQE